MRGDPCLEVTHARLVGPFSLKLRFSDGTEKRVNLRDELWGKVFEPLRDPTEFGKVRLDREAGTIVWPNGADLAPEFLHDLPDETPPRTSPPASRTRAVTRRRRTRSRSEAPGRSRRGS